MKKQRGLKWRFRQDYRVNDVEAAIDLAETFRKKGFYNWFRGQVKLWLPYSSLTRVFQLRDSERNEQAWAKLGRFESFIRSHKELSEISADQDAFFAVAQHYGMPTNYLDFTTEPAIAGFFACDTKKPEPGSDSCIYCLNIDDIRDAWETLRLIDAKAEVELVTSPVPNLWRLESQRGVFLYCVPNDWDVWYEMDRIVFPFRGYPAYPPRDLIYPKNKSALEILLDHFLTEERRREGREAFSQMLDENNIPFVPWVAPAEFYFPEYTQGGHLEPHSTWGKDSLSAWLDATPERLDEMPQREIPLYVDSSWSPEDRRRRVRTAIAGALRIHLALRHSLVTWRFDGQPLAPRAVGGTGHCRQQSVGSGTECVACLTLMSKSQPLSA